VVLAYLGFMILIRLIEALRGTGTS
jgi:hypothetical protein